MAEGSSSKHEEVSLASALCRPNISVPSFQIRRAKIINKWGVASKLSTIENKILNSNLGGFLSVSFSPLYQNGSYFTEESEGWRHYSEHAFQMKPHFKPQMETPHLEQAGKQMQHFKFWHLNLLLCLSHSFLSATPCPTISPYLVPSTS